MQKIIPHLWFDSEAEEAARLYTSLFKNSRIGKRTYYGKAGFEIHRQLEARLMTVDFELEGQEFIGLNGGPIFKFTPAISFLVACRTKEEVESLWEKLSAGGLALMELGEYPSSEKHGWTQDRFGLSWQVTPTVLEEMLQDSDKEKVERVTNAFLKTKKFDIAELEKAFKGR